MPFLGEYGGALMVHEKKVSYNTHLHITFLAVCAIFQNSNAHANLPHLMTICHIDGLMKG
jgi:hypothetical protein